MSLFDGISDIFHGKKSPKELIESIIKHITILNDSNTSIDDQKLVFLYIICSFSFSR